MATQIRNPKLSLIDDLLQNSSKFSLESAVYILEHKENIQFGKEPTYSASKIIAKSVTSFHVHANEIDNIKFNAQKYIIFTRRLAIAGLNAPLPTPYAEQLLRQHYTRDDSGLEFISIFNARLIGISYQISVRGNILLEHRGKSLFTKTVASFFGTNDFARNKMRLAYIFWNKEKSALGLKTILSSYFKFDVQVQQLYDISEYRGDDNRLGSIHFDRNAFLGTKASLQHNAVKIVITDRDSRRVLLFLSQSGNIKALKEMIRMYLGEFIVCRVELHPANTPPLHMGVKLGLNSWFAGQHADCISFFV